MKEFVDATYILMLLTEHNYLVTTSNNGDSGGMFSYCKSNMFGDLNAICVFIISCVQRNLV